MGRVVCFCGCCVLAWVLCAWVRVVCVGGCCVRVVCVCGWVAGPVFYTSKNLCQIGSLTLPNFS